MKIVTFVLKQLVTYPDVCSYVSCRNPFLQQICFSVCLIICFM